MPTCLSGFTWLTAAMDALLLRRQNGLQSQVLGSLARREERDGPATARAHTAAIVNFSARYGPSRAGPTRVADACVCCQSKPRK